MELGQLYFADFVQDLASGQKFKIMSDDEKVIDEKVPNGKRWAITVKLEIREYPTGTA